jgi:hypothetical protein
MTGERRPEVGERLGAFLREIEADENGISLDYEMSSGRCTENVQTRIEAC